MAHWKRHGKSHGLDRRGGIAVELGLTLPLWTVMLVGVLEWGLLLPRNSTIEHIARDAARTGALTPRSDGPESMAVARAIERLGEEGLDPGAATVTATVIDVDGDDAIEVSVQVPDDLIFGLVPTPLKLSADVTMRMEDQS